MIPPTHSPDTHPDLLLLPWLAGVVRDAEDRGSTFGWLDELLNRTDAP